jgi:hypothetical protein
MGGVLKMSIGDQGYGASLDFQQLCPFRVKFRFVEVGVGRPDITRAWPTRRKAEAILKDKEAARLAGMPKPEYAAVLRFLSLGKQYLRFRLGASDALRSLSGTR